MLEGSDPIADDELLLRRIPANTGWYTPNADQPLSPNAFKPHRDRDTTGLSVWRGKYRTCEEISADGSSSEYYIAVLRAGDLRAAGIEVTPSPESGLGHAELTNLRSENRNQTLELQQRLARELCLKIVGPFPGRARP